MYVVNTNINIHHVCFRTCRHHSEEWSFPRTRDPQTRHGTHCADTIGSCKYGVAEAANLIAVKTLCSNGSGTTANIVGGLLWATEQVATQLATAKA